MRIYNLFNLVQIDIKNRINNKFTKTYLPVHFGFKCLKSIVKY